MLACLIDWLNDAFFDEVRWYIYACCIKQKGTRGMDARAWRQFVADVDNCARGVDSRGQPLYVDDDGVEWGGILIFSEGDLEQMCREYGLPLYTAAGPCCGWCQADREDMPYTDLSFNASWRPTEQMPHNVCKVSSNVGLSAFECVLT